MLAKSWDSSIRLLHISTLYFLSISICFVELVEATILQLIVFMFSQGFKVCRYLFVRCDNEPAPWTRFCIVLRIHYQCHNFMC